MNRVVVAQLIETMNTGGAEHLAVQLANHAAGDPRFESHLIVIRDEGPMSARVVQDVRVHYLRFERASINRPLAFIGSIREGLSRLRHVLRDNHVAVVQTHLPAANFWGGALARRGPWRVVATVHNNQEFRYGPADLPWKIALRKLAYTQVVRRVAATVAVSEAVRRSLVVQLRLDARAAERIVVVPNGVQLPSAVEPSRRTMLREAWGVSPRDFLVVSVGRLDAQKNFGDLLAAAALRRPDDRWRVVIAGEGPQRAALQETIASRGLVGVVQLVGHVDDVPGLLAAADVFVSTALWEGLPLVVLEAMAAGLPVIGNAIDGLLDVVVAGESGYLVEPGHPELTAAAVDQLLADTALRERMGRSGRRTVEERFAFPRMARQIMDLYSEVPTSRSLKGASK